MRTLTIFSLSFLLGLVSTSAFAVDGVLEINQTCAVNTGCFPGDGAGFPVTITASGSYRFTSDLTNASAALHGIDVQVDNVTIDMNGFSLIGPVTCIGAGSTINCVGIGGGRGVNAFGRSHVSLLNGTVRGAGQDGVFLGNNCRIDGVTAQNNGRDGIGASNYCVIRNTSSVGNSDRGFSLGIGSNVQNCTSAQNDSYGIITSTAAVVGSNVVHDNGFRGISVSVASQVTNNSVYQNEDHGIFVSVSGSVINNSVYFNGTDAADHQISATSTSQITGNTVRVAAGTGFGLFLGVGATASGYSHNTIYGVGGSGTVSGGVNQGGNTCEGNTICP